jgi:predicted GH43/DUF377 family glycosyl hydrolase
MGERVSAAKKRRPVARASSVSVPAKAKKIAKAKPSAKKTTAKKAVVKVSSKKITKPIASKKIKVVIPAVTQKPIAKTVSKPIKLAVKPKAVVQPKPKARLQYGQPKKHTGAMLERFPDNPVVEPIMEHPWESKATFNPAALHAGGKIHMLYRAIGDTDVSVLGYAASSDGLHFTERPDTPAYVPRMPFEGAHRKLQPAEVGRQYISGGGGWGGCEDPRLTLIDGRVYLLYVAFDGGNPPRVALSSLEIDKFLAKDWEWTEPVLISAPHVVNKNAALLPEKVNGKYVIFHRVYPDILIDYVADLDFDGKTKWLTGQHKISPRKKFWDSRKIGVGATPIKTPQGWLLIYQAVGEQDSGRYKMGATPGCP